MPQCHKCGKKGLFLKIEGDTGLCLACNEEFARKGKVLTRAITEAKGRADQAQDPAAAAGFGREIEARGRELLDLHQVYKLQPSQELLDLIEKYRPQREKA
ncbi:MAG: hypothetical protein AB1896_06495 [Thermodesulfobacteriota bacterium]